jgi:hypothetical protein
VPPKKTASSTAKRPAAKAAKKVTKRPTKVTKKAPKKVAKKAVHKGLPSASTVWVEIGPLWLEQHKANPRELIVREVHSRRVQQP